MAEFREWPKTRRLFRSIVITEKIDGTNAAIHVRKISDTPSSPAVLELYPYPSNVFVIDGAVYEIAAQSRKRLITPQADTYGFAAWVHANAAELVTTLGEGLHFGEWWGSGIQRRYGLTDGERRFSLFNMDKWKDLRVSIGGVEVGSVPVLYHGEFSQVEIDHWLRNLAQFGSVAVPGFKYPEGICVWHSQTRQVFKVTLDNNDRSKWEAAQNA